MRALWLPVEGDTTPPAPLPHAGQWPSVSVVPFALLFLPCHQSERIHCGESMLADSRLDLPGCCGLDFLFSLRTFSHFRALLLGAQEFKESLVGLLNAFPSYRSFGLQ